MLKVMVAKFYVKCKSWTMHNINFNPTQDKQNFHSI